MKLKKKLLFNISLILLFMTLFLIGCSDSSEVAKLDSNEDIKNEGLPLVLTDQMERKVTVEKLPEKIVSLSPANTEILYVLDLRDKIVGVTDYCDYPEEVENKEKVGGFSDPNIEKIVSLEPDLVVCNDLHLQFVERLEEFDIPAIILDPKDFDDMFASIELVGQATGQSDKASVLVGDLKARIKAVEDIVAKAADDEPRKVYYEIWPSPMMTSGPGTYVNDIIERAGGENIAKDAKKDFPEYSQEMVVAKNPDIIVFSHHGSSSQSTEDILTRQGWENVNAIKNNRVYYIDENIVQRATPRLVDGLESFAEIIHPELF